MTLSRSVRAVARTRRWNRAPARASLAILALSILAAPTHAQTTAANADWNAEEILAAKEWVRPPATIAEAVLAPRHLNVTLTEISEDRRFFLDEVGDGPVKMDRFSRPLHELGGLFIDYQANRNRNLTIRSNVGIDVISAADGSKTRVEIPNGARVSNATFSPDGSKLAFFAHTSDATHIYVADTESGDSRQITRRPVLATVVQSFEWTADGRKVATVLIPEDRAPMPVEAMVPTGPQVKRTLEGENRLRTYASLMETPFHEELLEWHITGQLALIDVDNRRVERIGEPQMIRSFDFAPDGEHARVTRVAKPFSYIVPVNNFERVEEIWDLDGTVLTELDTTDMNVGLRRTGDDDDDDDEERRGLAWREDGMGLTFLQMEPRPDDEAEEEATPDDEEGDDERGRRKDRVMRWLPPFDDSSLSVVYESDTRMSSHNFSEDHSVLFVESRRGSNVHRYAVFLDDPEETHTLARFDNEEFYENPGRLVMTGGNLPGGGGFGGFFFGGGGSAAGTVQLSADGEHVFFSGTTFNEDPMAEAPKAFLDKIAIRTGESERIWEASDNGVSERITAILDIEAGEYVVSRESPTQIAQSYRRSSDGGLTQLTNNVDYTPDITNAPTERFAITRPDGFRFRVTVNLPADYRPGTRLPAMFWFYPREYTDQESYDERGRTYNKNAFENFRTRSMEFLTRLGYAVVEPDAPIVGEAGKMNNNYEHDLRNNLAAVIDELDERGLIDRRRLGIGGHSYGAFGTANAMVHTPFFKAGIAGDGNYNRTLTPLTFQTERRIFWDAKDVYLSMSPFMHANNLTGALLMYHGLMDQNVGTHPTHAPRLFHALNGLNKDAALYMYPFEGHGPATEETLLDLWARWSAWLEVHLKAPDTEEKRITTEDSSGS